MKLSQHDLTPPPKISLSAATSPCHAMASLAPPHELDHAGSFTLSLGHSHSPLEEHAGGRAREILPWRGSSYRQRELGSHHMAAHPAAGYIETDRRAGRDRAHGRVGRGSRSRGRGAPKQCSSCLTLTLPPLPLLRARGGIRDARDAVASQRYGRRRTGWQPAARAANRREVKREASTCADARARRSAGAALSWRDAGPRGRRTWPAPAAGDLTAPALSSPANKFRLEKPNREFFKNGVD